MGYYITVGGNAVIPVGNSCINTTGMVVGKLEF